MAGYIRFFALPALVFLFAVPSAASAQTLVDDWRVRWEAYKAEHDLVMARNQAWPKPFNCHDRQLFYQIWQVHYDAGWQVAHTLTDLHFDAENNQLNQAGRAKVGWIMTNSPQHRRAIYVLQDASDEQLEQRMASIRELMDLAYVHLGDAHVAVSSRVPHPANAQRYETLNERYLQTLPPPVLPASNESIRSAITR